MLNLKELALSHGFDAAAVVETGSLTFVPEYREFCEENLCGQYNVNPSCPPECGTAEQLQARASVFEHALVLQTIPDCACTDDAAVKKAKLFQNQMTEALARDMKDRGITEMMLMTAGPYKTNSCMSAYCLDAQKTAELAGMECWTDDGKTRLFTLILFSEA